MRDLPGTLLGLASVAAHIYFLLCVKHRYDLSGNGGPSPPDWVQLWIPIFLISIACEAVYLYLTKKQPLRLNDSVASLGTGLVMQTAQRQSMLLIGFIPYVYIYDNYRFVTWSDSWYTWMGMFLGVELGYYWLHRMSHTVASFWASHHVHHSSEEYNLTTALRQSVFMSIFSWIYYIPLAFLFSPSLFHAHAQFHLLYQYWIHTETVPKLGPLEWIINTPSQHRVHHARNPIYVDKNYGGTLCIFDRIFGTFQEELDSELCVYGVIGPLNSFDAVEANTKPYYNVWKKMHAAPSLVAALRSLWERPGWQTDGTELKPPVVNVATVRKYNPHLPFPVLLYTALQFAFALIYYVTCLSSNAPLSLLERHAVCVAIYTLFIGNGALLNRSSYAFTLEALRFVASTLLFYFMLPSRNSFWIITAIHAVAFLGLLYPYRTAVTRPLRTAELSSDGPSTSVASTTPTPAASFASAAAISAAPSVPSSSSSKGSSPRGRSPRRRQTRVQ